MKKIILGSLLLIAGIANAQDSKNELIGNANSADKIDAIDTVQGWETGGIFTLNFSNVGLQNWAAGGSNSYSITGLIGVYANLTKGNSTWDNSLDLGLGSIQQFAPGTPSKEKIWVKSDDKIDLTSKYGQKASDKWFYSGLFNFKSQMMSGYNDPYAPDSTKITISNFLAPAYAIAAIGMDYKPNSNVSVFIAPVTAKFTIVADDDLNAVGAFGVDSNSTVRTEMGFYLRLLYKKDVAKNVNFSSKLELFQNYETLGHIDVNWETLTAMKVNEYISATFATTLIYDDDIDIAHDFDENGVAQSNGPAVQFKHVLSVGLTYKF